MWRNELSIQELGSSRILVYKGDVEKLNFNLNLPNILTFVRTTFVDVPLCYFDVTGKTSLREVQKYALDKFDLLKILKISALVANTCIHQNIDLNSILFDEDYVFIDGEFNTFFVPLRSTEGEKIDLHTFMKNIVVGSIIDVRYTDNFVQLLLNCFNDPHFSIDTLLALVEQMISTKPFNLSENLSSFVEPDVAKDTAPPAAPSTPSSYTDTVLADMLKKQLDSAKAAPAEQQAATSSNTNINANQPTPIINSGFMPNLPPPHRRQQDQTGSQPEEMRPDRFSGEYDSQYLQQGAPNSGQFMGQAYLIDPESQGNRVHIKYNPFRVGRNPDLVDFIINSPYVGRLHALITQDEDTFLITDKSSTNGTYLNTHKLTAEEAIPLKNGDVIRFAKHSFQFVIE